MQLHALSSIQQLHLYAIVFENELASKQRIVVEEATYTPLICYENSLWTKKQPATLGNVEGRLSWVQYAQQGLRSSLQIIEHQVVAIKSLLSGLKGAPMDVKFRSEIGTPHTKIEVMNHIKVLLKLTENQNIFFFKMMGV